MYTAQKKHSVCRHCEYSFLAARYHKEKLNLLCFAKWCHLRYEWLQGSQGYEPAESCWNLTASSCFPQAWGQLEKAEHEREAALRAELIRQEKLELLAQRFDHKVAMRESWLNENQRLVSQVQGIGLGSGGKGIRRARLMSQGFERGG